MKARIGWIGLGLMGSVMAPRLAAAGWAVTGFDPDPSRAGGLPIAGSLAELAAGSDVLVSMIPHDAAFAEVARGVAGAARSGTVLIDMSTVSPDASAAGAEVLAKAGVDFLRAPVSGSTGLAAAGTLSLLVSGPEEVFAAQRPILETLGQRITWLGTGEQARATKLVVNSVVAAINGALAEALQLGQASGLDRAQLVDLIAGSAAASPYIASKVDKLKAHDHSPAATVNLIGKDLDMVLALAQSRGVAMPLAALNRARAAEAEAAGWGLYDLSSLADLPPADTAATILTLEDARYDAMLAADTETLDRLLDPGLRYIHSSGGTDSKDSYLAAFASGLFRYRRIARSEQSLQISGETALVLNRLEIDIDVQGTPREVRAKALAVWSRASGCWRLICVQSVAA
ncbi:NAD(P)-binding domain-containing protein [Gemmobacter sp.]|uniref:NAD(P)-binding domain-containing protein n=1 Tax=Gemmobacter sp. TaxID=1898957 RepID=UPI002AFF8691|nr:NAD(P)-binding domain-containing protein [Gemmobacter sp.]